MAEISLSDFFAHDHRYKPRNGLYRDYSDYTLLIAIRYYMETRDERQCKRLREHARAWQPGQHSPRSWRRPSLHQALKGWMLGDMVIPFDGRNRPGWRQQQLTRSQITPNVRSICKALDKWLLNPYPAPPGRPLGKIVVPPMPDLRPGDSASPASP
jgi:hypothetical protein